MITVVEQARILAAALDSPDDLLRVLDRPEAVSIDLRRRLAACLPVLLPDDPLAWLAASTPPDPDAEIASLYREIGALAESGAPEHEARFQAALARLRALQREEAARMTAYLDAHSPLGPGQVDDAIRRADDMLARHEAPSSPDPSRDDSD